jgi:hypothetical protein
MKATSILTFGMIILLFMACQSEDESMLASSELPAWLEEQIKEDELIISSDSTRMPIYGAWIRYEFENSYYFEYDNPVSSLSRNPYSWQGNRVDWTQSPYIDYWDKRCCKKYIWMAPRYIRVE